MTEARVCPSCGVTLPTRSALAGLCPACTWNGLWEEESLHERGVHEVPNKPGLMRVAGYEVVGEIARGGMGIVYRAKQLDPARTVALKMLLPFQSGSSEMAQRFRMEVRALTELEHPAILPVYQVGEHEGLPFFTMKLASGGTLAQRKQTFVGQWRDIAELMAALADAVQFAHDRGVLHRDLKPGNILFDEKGRPYVSDFGLAKFETVESDLTQATEFLGTPHYAAPEVAAGNARSATTASDIYSLGAILYELLGGHPPFEAEGMPGLLKKITEDEPARLDAAVPRDLKVICLKCLAKRPEGRYGTAHDLAADLRRWLQGHTIWARPATRTERARAWARRNPALAVLVTVLPVVLVSAILLQAETNRRLRVALQQAKDAEVAAVANLHASLLSQARSLRESNQEQKGPEQLQLLARAAGIRPTPETRAEAAAALSAGAGSADCFREFSRSPFQRQACTVDISPDGQRALTAAIEGLVMWDTETGAVLWKLAQRGTPWAHAFFHFDGRSFCHSALSLGIQRREFRETSDTSARLEVSAPQFLSPTNVLLLGTGDQGRQWLVGLDAQDADFFRVQLWPDGRAEDARTVAAGERIRGISLSPDGRWATSTTYPPSDLRVWDALTGKMTRVLAPHGAVTRAFSPDNRWLLARIGEEYRVWQIGSWKPGPSWHVDQMGRTIRKSVFSPDGRWLAWQTRRESLQIRETDRFSEIVTLTAPEQIDIVDVKWDRTSRHLYVLSSEHRLFRWDLVTMRQELAKLGLDWKNASRQ